MDDSLTWTPAALTGRSRDHVVDLGEPRCTLHRDVVEPFLRLRAAARQDGIDLVPVSSFRDFARQVSIWNAKCQGERELLDRNGLPLDALALSEDRRVEAILHWSALPGASRHHWGTEIDVIDAAALPAGEPVRLVTAEYAEGGRFAHLDRWLERSAAECGFYRPYRRDRGGVQPEPWHLSYAPVAGQALAKFSLGLLREALVDAGIAAPEAVARRLPEIYQRYVLNVDPPPWAQPLNAPGSTPS